MKDRFKTHGAFSWTELMTDDIDKAKHFYAEVFGWQLEDAPMDDGTYTIISADGEQMGGMMSIPPRMEGSPSHWGTYVTVDDVDAAFAKATELGATTMVPPTDIPNVGRFCMFGDPSGAIISAISYVETKPE